jgi:phage-related protein (TIGR01555 family)
LSNRLTSFRDSLFNLITGLGTGKDPTRHSQWHLRLLNRNEVENAYRSDWVARKIIDAPAEDATREWRAWQADQDVISCIEATEELHKVQVKTRQALIRARLYGGAALVFAVKGQDPATELDMEGVGKGDLEFVVVMNRYELMAGPRIFNVESPYYTRPEYYTVSTPVFGFENEAGTQYPTTDPKPANPKDKNRQQTPLQGMVQVHPSRVIEFTGNELPDWRLVPMGGGWGDSVLQTVDDVLKDIGMVIGGIATMVNDAKVDIIKIPDFSKQIATTEYANRLLARFAYANQAKSTVNSLLLDTNEEWERVESNFGSLPNVLHEYLMIAGGAAGIPMSILIGQSGGRGLGGSGGGSSSSGGESGGGSDVRNYYDRVRAKQDTVYGPAMAPLDQVLVRSSIGRWDPSITYNWNPLYQDDATTVSANETAKQTAMKTLVETGLINEDVLRAVQVNMLSEQEDFWIGIEDAIEEYGAEPEEPDIQVPWSRLAGAMAQLSGGGGNGGGNGNGNSASGGGGNSGGGNNGGSGGGKPDILGALGAKLAPPKLPNMRVTSDAAVSDDKGGEAAGSVRFSISGETAAGNLFDTAIVAKSEALARQQFAMERPGWIIKEIRLSDASEQQDES